MNTINFKFEQKEYKKTSIFVNGQLAGYIEVSGEEIMYSFLEEEYRGKGLYKMMLIASINLGNEAILYSFNRNEYSNPCYEKWVNDSLDAKEPICITLEDESLVFTKVSDL